MVLEELRLGSRTTIRPGDHVRLSPGSAKRYRVSEIREDSVVLWGPVLKNGMTHAKARFRFVRSGDIAGKFRK